MKLLEDMEPVKMLLELRRMDVELRKRQKVQTLLEARIAFVKTMLKGKYKQELLDAHCEHGDGDCPDPVAFSVYHPGYFDEDEANHALVCKKHKPEPGGIGFQIEEYPR